MLIEALNIYLMKSESTGHSRIVLEYFSFSKYSKTTTHFTLSLNISLKAP